MTRKDYESIAYAIWAAQPFAYRKGEQAIREAQTAHVAERVAAAIARTNSRFDSTQFLKLCKGVQS
jgi:hypothetical protein